MKWPGRQKASLRIDRGGAGAYVQQAPSVGHARWKQDESRLRLSTGCRTCRGEPGPEPPHREARSGKQVPHLAIARGSASLPAAHTVRSFLSAASSGTIRFRIDVRPCWQSRSCSTRGCRTCVCSREGCWHGRRRGTLWSRAEVGGRCDGDSDVIHLPWTTGLPGAGRGAMKNVHRGGWAGELRGGQRTWSGVNSEPSCSSNTRWPGGGNCQALQRG